MKQIQIPYLSYGLWRYLPRWRSFFDEAKVSVGFHKHQKSMILGWGYKPSGRRALALSQHGISQSPCLIEDGFLRSIDLGVNGDDPLSLVVDDLGIYYDATKSSRLEKLILDSEGITALLSDGARALQLVVDNNLTKYNHLLEGLPSHLSFSQVKPQVLVIDQTFGDMSLIYGGVTPATFQEMLQAAIIENPEADIWVKVHPDVLAGKKEGHYSDLLLKMAQSPEEYQNLRILAEDIHPHSLLEKMDKVYVATSQMGFEALMLGKEVVVFGLSWYAGWGLTDDRNTGIDAIKKAGRRREATLIELFTASYLQYCRYINPFINKRGTIFDVIDYLIMMKRREKLLQGEIWIVGLSWWKRKIMSPFLKTTNNQLRFFKTAKALQSAFLKQEGKIRLLLWGKKFPELEYWASENRVAILRMEDGFIRSVGLGSNLVAPRSLVIDDCGIYFDASCPSRLERILEETSFSPKLLQDAEQLKAELVTAKVGKYNVGDASLSIDIPTNQKVILVPGQVEDDASIQTGTREIRTNLELLQQVRRQNPDAYIIYKPHPDVVSGNRVGNIPDEKALHYADIIMPEIDIIVLMEQCDELHTMTSLSGFEALLRDKKVYCYGIPFYAGWGLTTDLYQLENRRQRRLSLPELIAGTLMLYPEYLDIETGKLTNAMTTLKAISKERSLLQTQRLKTNWPMRKWKQLQGLLRTFKW